MGKLFEYPETKSVVVCGDIHGDFHTLAHKMCIQYQMADALLIVAGDCGFGFDKPAYYEQVYNKDAGLLRKANNWIVFVRGNHDNSYAHGTFILRKAGPRLSLRMGRYGPDAS